MRANSPTHRLTAATFGGAAGSSLFYLVRVDTGLPKIHRGVAEFFRDQYPDLMGFGTLPARETRATGWWEHHFRTRVGPVRGNRTGYFLFCEGEVVGTHPGRVRHDVRFDDGDRTPESGQRAQAELEFIRRVAFEGRRVPEVDLAIAVELITYFDGIVSERQERRGFREGASQRSGGTASRVSRQQIAIPGESGSPFAVLKIEEDATDEEIRAAYKLQMKLNHPDKVSHMSPEIQAYAQAWTKVIRAAYEALKK